MNITNLFCAKNFIKINSDWLAFGYLQSMQPYDHIRCKNKFWVQNRLFYQTWFLSENNQFLHQIFQTLVLLQNFYDGIVSLQK